MRRVRLIATRVPPPERGSHLTSPPKSDLMKVSMICVPSPECLSDPVFARGIPRPSSSTMMLRLSVNRSTETMICPVVLPWNPCSTALVTSSERTRESGVASCDEIFPKCPM